MGDLACCVRGLEEPIAPRGIRAARLWGLGRLPDVGKLLSDTQGVETCGERKGWILLLRVGLGLRQDPHPYGRNGQHMRREFFRLKEHSSPDMSSYGQNNFEHRLSPCWTGRPEGLSLGNVFGTYVHGCLKKAEFVSRFVNCLLPRKASRPASSAWIGRNIKKNSMICSRPASGRRWIWRKSIRYGEDR